MTIIAPPMEAKAKPKAIFSENSTNLNELRDLLAIVSEGKRIWESTFDAIVDPVLIVTQDYKIERANFAAASSAKMDVRDLVGQRCFEAFAKRSSPCPRCPMPASREKSSHRRKTLKPFSDERSFAASAFPVRGKSGEDLGLVVMQYQDRSTIQKLEAQVRQNEKMAALGLFASGVAHDLNNPLAGVLAFAQLAMQGVEKESQTYSDLKEIEASALRCKKILDNLVNFSKPIEQSALNSVDLCQIIRNILPNLEVQWQDKEYQLVQQLEPVPPVKVSESKFEQVFTNLLANAYQAIAPGGKISIRSGQEADMVYLDISDNGAGIAKENLEKIFDPYFTTKGKRGGTGLGLPTTYNIVREHGGRIKVKSQMGAGASFRVFVPKGEES